MPTVINLSSLLYFVFPIVCNSANSVELPFVKPYFVSKIILCLNKSGSNRLKSLFSIILELMEIVATGR